MAISWAHTEQMLEPAIMAAYAVNKVTTHMKQLRNSSFDVMTTA